ncbi:MAG: phosphoglucomutase/phosphomannomutase family protein, partial [Dehalococcoidales bacterium]|nr:phosphoglucomutase/phosphomannomutase family protein [Dehalococcoidales bacterium]
FTCPDCNDSWEVGNVSSPIKFGTDGWRGVIAEDFTFANVRACAQGVASYLKRAALAPRGLIIGYDTRFASEDFAAAAAEIIAGNGIKVYLCPKAAPTPVISFGVLTRQAGGAIIITASHNPAAWNGFKCKSESGSSVPPEVTDEIEKHISDALATGRIDKLPLAKAREQRLVEYLDLAPLYFDHIARLVDLDSLRQAKIKVVVDAMYGAGAGYLKALVGKGTIDLVEINGERNPLFPGIERPEPIGPNLVKLMATVRESGANVGLATDGDADRIGVVDEKGNFLTTLQVFALLALYLLEVRGERGPIVKTITNTSMVYRLGEIFNVPVYETSVGFKYVAPVMLAENALIGGEESGGYGFRGHVLERDGILAALYFLDLVAKTGKNPSQLIDYLYSKVGPHHFDRRDITFPEAKRPVIMARLGHNPPDNIEDVSVVRFDTADGFRFVLTDGTWLLIRFSGTEPLLRIYAESSTPARVARLLELGKTLAGVDKG